MAVTKAATHTGASDAAMWAVASVTAWDASSGTGSGNACGGCEAVEDPRCTAAGNSSRASGYATAEESLATGSNCTVQLFLL